MLIATFMFGWFSSSTPQDSVEDARLLAWTWDSTAIALSVDAPTLARLLQGVDGVEPVILSTDGGTYARYALPDRSLDGVAVGSAWRLLGSGKELACTVTGLGLIASPGFSMGSEIGTGAPCMAPLVFADIDCGGQALPWEGLAVPEGSGAQVATAGEPVSIETPMGAVTAALRDEAIRAVRAEASVWASEQGEPLRTELSTTAYALGERSMLAVEGRFLTGEGEDFCGGQDVSAEWGGLMLDGAPRGMHAMPDGRILGVFDLDGDGSPEVLEQDASGTVLRGAGGQIIRRSDEEWCVCGC